jgi:hypothetical protein
VMLAVTVCNDEKNDAFDILKMTYSACFSIRFQSRLALRGYPKRIIEFPLRNLESVCEFPDPGLFICSRKSSSVRGTPACS